jgi:hypothetical protein
MAELRASPVVNPSYKRIADVLANLQGPMGEIIPFTDANPFKFLMPAASTFENLAYGNSPFSEYAGVTNRRLPIVKTGREGELTDIADVALMASGLPMASRGVARGANYLGDVLTQATRAAPPAAPMRAVSEIAEAAPITPKPPPPEPVRSDIGFYSQLEAATNPLQDKGTGDQFLSQLQKSAGVKPDEIKYTGLDEFLKGKKAVTKAEIQGYLASNKVDVQEVRLGDLPFSEQAFNDRFARRGFSMVQTDDGPQFTQTDMTGRRQLNYGELPEDIQATIENQYVPNTKYHLGALKNIDTEIPGGENYRELLLTLPSSRPSIKNMSRAEYNAAVEAADRAGVQDFISTHFDQPNVLAHMRVNDRVVDGKKTLFIEEIQSDWHQAGRKRGYGNAAFETAQKQHTEAKDALAQEILKIDPQANVDESITSLRRHFNGSILIPQMTPEIDVALRPLVNREMRLLETLNREKLGGGIPDAPFKTSWHELSLKRAIQEASEKGYDQIAFTTGKTQAERYDLSKQVNSLKVERNTTGNYSLRIKRTDADKTFEPLKSNVSESELPDYIGKDLAQKIIEEGSGSRDFSKVYSGLDLQVGGEGMKGFYDQILPKSLEKLGKKFDAKVGKTQMDGVEVWQMNITPKMRESVTTKGQPLFSISGLGAGAIGSGFYQDDTMEQLSR